MIRSTSTVTSMGVKLLTRKGEAISRFRTRQGDRPSAKEWVTLGTALFDRVLRRTRHEPWLPPSAVRYLDGALSADDVVLELGGGASTPWFAKRVRLVHAIEPDPHWADRIEAATHALSNVKVTRGSVRSALTPIPSPDVVVIDHRERVDDITRPEALLWAVALEPKPRLIVLDDSDRPEYRAALRPFDDRLVFRGFRSHAIYLTETAIIAPRRP